MALTYFKSIFSKINTLPIPFLQQAPLTRQQKLISHVSKILDAVAKPEIIIGCAFATLLAFCTLQIENSKPEVIKIKTRYANHKIEKGSIVFTETKYQIMQYKPLWLSGFIFMIIESFCHISNILTFGALASGVAIILLNKIEALSTKTKLNIDESVVTLFLAHMAYKTTKVLIKTRFFTAKDCIKILFTEDLWPLYFRNSISPYKIALLSQANIKQTVIDITTGPKTIKTIIQKALESFDQLAVKKQELKNLKTKYVNTPKNNIIILNINNLQDDVEEQEILLTNFYKQFVNCVHKNNQFLNKTSALSIEEQEILTELEGLENQDLIKATTAAKEEGQIHNINTLFEELIVLAKDDVNENQLQTQRKQYLKIDNDNKDSDQKFLKAIINQKVSFTNKIIWLTKNAPSIQSDYFEAKKWQKDHKEIAKWHTQVDEVLVNSSQDVTSNVERAQDITQKEQLRQTITDLNDARQNLREKQKVLKDKQEKQYLEWTQNICGKIALDWEKNYDIRRVNCSETSKKTNSLLKIFDQDLKKHDTAYNNLVTLKQDISIIKEITQNTSPNAMQVVRELETRLPDFAILPSSIKDTTLV